MFRAECPGPACGGDIDPGIDSEGDSLSGFIRLNNTDPECLLSVVWHLDFQLVQLAGVVQWQWKGLPASRCQFGPLLLTMGDDGGMSVVHRFLAQARDDLGLGQVFHPVPPCRVGRIDLEKLVPGSLAARLPCVTENNQLDGSFHLQCIEQLQKRIESTKTEFTLVQVDGEIVDARRMVKRDNCRTDPCPRSTFLPDDGRLNIDQHFFAACFAKLDHAAVVGGDW